jgi:serine O-acetyltransferase
MEHVSISGDDAASPVETIEPDWNREKPVNREWKPGLFLLKSLRDYQNAGNPVSKRWAVLRHRLWSAATGADIPLNSQIEGGLLIPHPTGIVIHPLAKIGPNVLIFQQVTIGDNGGLDGAPVIEGGVTLGAGCRILGNIRIGKGAKVGANAVVLQDVPAGATAVGVPARIL